MRPIVSSLNLPRPLGSGRHRVATGGKDGETAFLQIKFASVKTLPPIGKQKRYAPQNLVYIHALEGPTFGS